MEHQEDAVCVLTANGLETLLEEGGSQAWVLDAKRAGQCLYVVCIQNRTPATNLGKPTADHHTAFLVAKLDRVVRSQDPGNEKRWFLGFSEYAELDVTDAWPGYRNPVFYTNFKEHFGLDIADLEFHPMPSAGEIGQQGPATKNGLTIPEAKAGLALTFGVKPSDIEITIRG